MKLEDIRAIGIMGGGVMGGGIAQTAILAGYKTIVRDLGDEILAKMQDTIINGRFGLKGGVERGKYTQQQMDRALANLSMTTKVEGLKGCDLIIEAIGGSNPQEIENKDLKLKVFAELDGFSDLFCVPLSLTVYTENEIAILLATGQWYEKGHQNRLNYVAAAGADLILEYLCQRR